MIQPLDPADALSYEMGFREMSKSESAFVTADSLRALASFLDQLTEATHTFEYRLSDTVVTLDSEETVFRITWSSADEAYVAEIR